VNLRMCFNTNEDKFPLPTQIKKVYGPFGFPEFADTGRPYITSNLVMALDGKASFRELKGRAGGNVVSMSADDRWLMDFYRAHHDAQLIGASTLREELGADGKSLDYGIDDEELRTYRRDILKLGLQKIIVLTGSGNLDVSAPLFESPRVEPWIITSVEGERNLRAQRPREMAHLKLFRLEAADASMFPPRCNCCVENMESKRCFARAAQISTANF